MSDRATGDPVAGVDGGSVEVSVVVVMAVSETVVVVVVVPSGVSAVLDGVLVKLGS